jgi:hypothetical protein
MATAVAHKPYPSCPRIHNCGGRIAVAAVCERDERGAEGRRPELALSRALGQRARTPFPSRFKRSQTHPARELDGAVGEVGRERGVRGQRQQDQPV